MTAISQRAYARHRGVSPMAVTRAIESGRITTDADGKIDPEVADKQWSENTHPGYQPDKNTASEKHDTSRSMQTSRAMEKAYDAALKKLEYEERSGKLIPTIEMERDVFNAARTARDQWKSAPRRIIPQIIGKTNFNEIEIILNKEFDDFIQLLTGCLRGNKS